MPWRSLRLSARRELALPSQLPGAIRRRAKRPGATLAVGLVVPIASAVVLSASGIVSPAYLDRNILGTLWQVEAALVGLAIALALYGYETLGRQGGTEPSELEELALPRSIYLGLALILLTGLAFLEALDPPIEPNADQGRSVAAWLGFGAVFVAICWAGLLLRALPEVVRVGHPGPGMHSPRSPTRSMVGPAAVNTHRHLLRRRLRCGC